MYMTICFYDEEGNLRELTVKNKCDIICPNGIIDNFKFYISTADLLRRVYSKVIKYADEKYRIVKVQSDNTLIVRKLQAEGIKAEFMPKWDEDV